VRLAGNSRDPDCTVEPSTRAVVAMIPRYKLLP
jgi:hypothetical protein